ncbi:carbohydrate-binding protein [Filimonas effusa]|uniref:Carbohydrate-binding protein n=1 Tax=Filimonas effusa TaxID=2508721 RepID=A0A4Q1D871_9BACT|nr:carbohydrate-binding protein [Filimonas effusa]RXK85517.1 carbohydrate-binding protein [Filimonas effusa]
MKHMYFQSLAALAVLCLLFCKTTAQVTIPVGSTTRSMIVYVPTNLPANQPLIISMHGSGQGADYQQNASKWEPIADTAKFAVVFPSGINKQWDISGTSDINFITAIIDTMYRRYAINRNRVYLSGFSMGGMMTYHAATQIANKIAAFAPVSGYPLWGSNYNSSRPVPIIHVHGDADDVVTYNNLGTYLNGWINRNQCPTTPQITQPYPSSKPNSVATKRYWGPGLAQSEVVLITLAGKGHWYSMDSVNGVNTSQEIWNFVKRFSLGAVIEENSVGFCNVDGTIDTNYPGYTGSGFANTNNAAGNGIRWSVNFPNAGTQTFAFRYAAIDNRPAKLLINGVTVAANINFPATSSWSNWTTISVPASVSAGVSSVRLEATGGSGLPNIDRLEVTEGTGATCTSNILAVAADSTGSKNLHVSDVTPAEQQISVYPNPASSYIIVKVGKYWKPGDQLLLFNAQGKTLQRRVLKGNQEELNVASLSTGVYYVQVSNKRQQRASQSFLKK